MDTIKLDQLISSLERSVNSAEPFKTKWKPIWEQIKEISSAFKDTRYPSKEGRQRRWEHFQNLVQEVKAVQAKEQEQWEERSNSSESYKDRIIACAEAAKPAGALGDFIVSLVSLPVRPIMAMLPGDYDEKHEELKACSKSLKEGWQLISRHKNEMTGRHKKEAFESLKAAQESLNAAWEKWKEGKAQAKAARDDYFRSKRETFQSKVRERIETHKERLEKLYSVLSKCEAHLDSLRDQRNSAWSDSFRDRVEGWIDEEEDRISSIKEKIDRIEGWLDEDRRKLE
jgi:hypothetical protein